MSLSVTRKCPRSVVRARQGAQGQVYREQRAVYTRIVQSQCAHADVACSTSHDPQFLRVGTERAVLATRRAPSAPQGAAHRGTRATLQPRESPPPPPFARV